MFDDIRRRNTWFTQAMIARGSTLNEVERIRENIRRVRERIAAACTRVGRDPSGVLLIGVTKTWGPDVVMAAWKAGLEDFGENYAQELVEKARVVKERGGNPRWHFIGGLQTNKVKVVVGLVHSVQSVDRESLVRELGRRLEGGRVLDVFVEVNLGGETQKSGVAPGEAEALCARVLEEPTLRLAGLMCVPPFFEDAEASRPYFRELRRLRDKIVYGLGVGEGVLEGLSMGMSHDFEVAIEEGATVIRVGTALFGARGRR